MTCWKCTAKIPDGTAVCPICSAVQNRKVSFRVKFFRWMLWACPLVSIIANTVNLYLLITGAHYLTDLRFGILPGRFDIYTTFPSVYWMDMALLATIWIIYGLIIAMAVCAQRQKSSAPVMLLITNIAIFLWSLSYLFFSILLTNIVSPVLAIVAVQMALQAAWTVFSCIYWYRSYVFVY